MSESNRVFTLPSETIEGIVDLGYAAELSSFDLNQLLPGGLSTGEVSSIGLQVQDFVESAWQSTGRISRGLKAEFRSLFAIALLSIEYSDLITAGSCSLHLRSQLADNPHLEGVIYVRMLSREIKKAGHTI